MFVSNSLPLQTRKKEMRRASDGFDVWVHVDA